jgi:hypothetical protein
VKLWGQTEAFNGLPTTGGPNTGGNVLDFNPADPAHQRALQIMGQLAPPATKTQQATAGLDASIGKASAAIDQIGPHAAQAFGTATHAAAIFQAQLDHMTDKRLQVILDDQGAISSLERLQAFRIKDKSFTVTELQRDRAVGPGGGIGMPTGATGGYVTGPGTGTSDSILARLSNGEYVMTAAAVAAHGRAMFDRLNGYAGGGAVGSTSSPTDSATPAHTSAVKADTKALNDHQNKLQNVVSAEKQLAQSVTQSLRTDLFAQQTPWGQLASPIVTLQTDIANAKAFNRLEHRLAGRGLTGGALSTAEQGGLPALRLLAGDNHHQLDQFEHLFRERQRVTSHAGQRAGDQRYGNEIREVRDEVRKERREVVKLRHEVARARKDAPKNADRTAKGVGKQINNSSSTAVRRRRR